MQERGLKFDNQHQYLNQTLSLLMQERGLKSSKGGEDLLKILVAPYAGAWIEIFSVVFGIMPVRCRSLCRSVD